MNLDHGGGAQGARGARVGVFAQAGLEGVMEAGAPLEKMVGKGPARPPVRSCCNQQETQVMLSSFFT